MAEESPADNRGSLSGWECESCGKTSPRNDSPCGRCGSMNYEPVYGTEHEPGELEASLTSRVRRNRIVIGVVAVIGLAIVALVAAYLGLFVIADPVTGMRFGAVGASTPDAGGELTASEFHGRVGGEIDTDYLLWYGSTLRLEYHSTATTDRGLGRELGTIISAYTAYIGDGGEAAKLEIVATGPGEYRSTFHIKTEWAEAHLSGELSGYEYTQRVVSTQNA